MELANQRAIEALVKPQNALKTGTIDLHGLYLKEAMAEVVTFLDHHLENKAYKEIIIITGAGHHSKKHDQPVIRPAVEKHLQQKHIAFKEISNRGALLVTVPNGKKDLTKV